MNDLIVRHYKNGDMTVKYPDKQHYRISETNDGWTIKTMWNHATHVGERDHVIARWAVKMTMAEIIEKTNKIAKEKYHVDNMEDWEAFIELWNEIDPTCADFR